MKPILETERLILRDIDPDLDFEAYAEICADAETMKYLGGAVMDRAQAWRSMAMVMGHKQIRGYGFLSVIEKATGAWVGRVGHWAPLGWPAPEIGWTIHKDHRRKGYATEAGKACVGYAYDTLGWTRIIHVIQEGNVASVKTAEKLGSTLESTQNGIPPVTEEKCWIYAQERG